MLRSPFAEDPGLASDVFVTLGTLAEERGTDSAGLALLGDWPGLGGPGTGGASCRVVKGRGRFSGIWRPEFLPELDRAPVALGHTRWATQGSPAEADNASPMVVPGTAAAFPATGGPSAGVVATHNGDIDAAGLRARFAPPPASGTTDSEPVFQLLAGCRTPSDVTGVLEALVGRVALAWVDRDRPTQVHLARGALSPLTVAVDTDQNIYWASNPRWFREAERHTRVRFATAVMLREGTYLKVGMESRPGRRDLPEVLATATFVPTARDTDMDPRVWTGFTRSDADSDRVGLLHRVVEREGGTGGLLTVA
ncbi:class II glutamine amidotransferase [Spirillospora sp. CA-128828]|uniref:class II glutamine amidotransferase n=1 Tax=Spirillospora sp. CA-128828 TaxID=3240033 RepID=UPI003D89BD04